MLHGDFRAGFERREGRKESWRLWEIGGKFKALVHKHAWCPWKQSKRALAASGTRRGSEKRLGSLCTA